ncbi:Z1 domain-containing protein [Flammeovirga sp. SubArs3]|uniref:Z1 domain-containing protein n=1 Tax=Flammeovirga sp. SubArs3 TaxID=2995316 RepID=UPI00248B9C34|nr:Z1 domain-containing protein [Flammeovirga sp. SubArs3]
MSRKRISPKEIITDTFYDFISEINDDKGRITENQLESLKNELKDEIYKESVSNFNFLNRRNTDIELTSNDFDKLYSSVLNEYLCTYSIINDPSYTLVKENQSWLNLEREEKLKWFDEDDNSSYRNRYFNHLRKGGRTEKVIQETKKSSLDILKNLGDPESATSFFVKGAVVGSVQSGKTGNFNALINSSIDLGYRLIIVLSGIMEDLRIQTQIRIEKDVIGPEITQGKYLGVGDIQYFPDHIDSITDRVSDFKKTIVKGKSFKSKGNNILICKKNSTVLDSLLQWFGEYSGEDDLINTPLLIVDDEADNASLNNHGHKGKEEASKINKQIRAILHLFTQKSYVGYTATPFANILQDRNDPPTSKYFTKDGNSFEMEGNLFPDDFIELLTPPSNYVGIKSFFETRSEEVKKIPHLIEEINPKDFEEKLPTRFLKITGEPYIKDFHPLESKIRTPKKEDNYPNESDGLPNSLIDAVKCFILSVAIRNARKNELKNTEFYHPHNTMLIHISRFSDWQDRTAKQVQLLVDELTQKLNNDAIDSDVYKDFERIWNIYYLNKTSDIIDNLPEGYTDSFLKDHDFNEEIKGLLPLSIKGIEVLAINSKKENKDKKLFYPDLGSKEFKEKKYIAVGGNRLSRGFTLEGLTINYFLRETYNADTLMQMGRWFGYRPGYLDCCRLFTTEESIERFNEASLIMEDLENKFKELANTPNKKPSDFTIWIMNNPGVIKLTRPNFLKDLYVKSLSFSDYVEQSTKFHINKSLIETSFNAFEEHINKFKNWKHDDKYSVLETDQEGLKGFLNLPSTMINLNILGLDEYLESCKSKNKLTKWKIFIRKLGDAKHNSQKLLNQSFNPVIRRGPSPGTANRKSLINENIFKARNATIISPKDFAFPLSEDQIKKVETKFKENRRGLLEAGYIRNKDGSILTKDEIENKIKKIAIPDSEYRKEYDESEGILVIYLINLEGVFQHQKNDPITDDELTDYKIKMGLENINTPLIGYALGFPRLNGIPEKEYVSRHYYDNIDKDIEEMNLEELQNVYRNEVSNPDYDENYTTWDFETLIEVIKDLREQEDEL